MSPFGCGYYGCKDLHTVCQPLEGMDSTVHDAEARAA